MKDQAPSKRWSLHYAWVVVIVTSLVLLGGAGIRTVPQILLQPLEQEFGWLRADISFAVALSILWYGLGGPLGGTLIERLGLRRVMAIGLLLIAAGMAALLGLQSLWQLHLFYGFCVGVGSGMLANVLGAAVAQRWFATHRGLIVGLFGAATATGQLIFLPTLISLNESQGWRGALTVAAVVVAVLAIPVLLWMRERPEDVHQTKFGEDAVGVAETAENARSGTALADALRTRDFWLLAGSFFICGYTTNGLIGTHLLSHALEHGFTAEAAGTAIAIMGGLNVIGTLSSGWLSDRVDNRWLLATYYGLRALSLLVLPFVRDMSGFLVFAVFYGIDYMATVPPTVNLTAQRFGRSSVAKIYGWIFFSHMVGASTAAYAGGALRDQLGDYTLAFGSAALLGLIAAGLSLSIQHRRMVPVATAS